LREAANKSSETGILHKLGLFIATGGGAGSLPVAPGTFGSVEGVALFAALSAAARSIGVGAAFELALLSIVALAITGLGIWSAELYCRHSGIKDPRNVVIDEIAGQIITLLPLAGAPSVTGVALGFLLFRAFDILKPFPARRLERLKGGLGVVLDDLMAGAYAAVLLLAGRLYGLV
jgi:phosphatidylglycerophosphatase A